jgi:transcriptional regulator with XRE-family HTH domain
MIVLSKEEQNIAENVKRLMEDHDPPLSLRQLEERSGVNYGSIHAFLQGRHSPRFSMVWDLANALGVNVVDLTKTPKKRREKTPA